MTSLCSVVIGQDVLHVAARYVNGQRITPAMLTEHDTIDIGHTRFQLADSELRPCVD